MLLVGRAALWAAGLEGDVQFGAILGNKQAHMPLLGGKAGDVIIDPSANVEGTLSLQLVRAEDGLVVKLGESPAHLAKGAPTTMPVSVPRLRAGDYYLNALIRSQRGVEACGAGNVIVDSEGHPSTAA